MTKANLMRSSAAVAAALALAACGNADADADLELAEAEVETTDRLYADRDMDADIDLDADADLFDVNDFGAITLAQFTGDQLLETDLLDRMGEEIGEIDDVWIKDGRIQYVIFEDGDLFDMGDDTVKMAWDGAMFRSEADEIDDLDLLMPSTADMGRYVTLVADERDEIGYRQFLLSEITGEDVEILDNDGDADTDSGIIDDIVFNPNGTIAFYDIDNGILSESKLYTPAQVSFVTEMEREEVLGAVERNDMDADIEAGMDMDADLDADMDSDLDGYEETEIEYDEDDYQYEPK